MFSSNQPSSNQIRSAPRHLVSQTCLHNNAAIAPVVGRFDECAAILHKAVSPQSLHVCLERLGAIFHNLIESGNAGTLQSIQFVQGLKAPGSDVRLEVAELIGDLLTIPGVSGDDNGLREQVALSCLIDIFASRLVPSTNAVSELRAFVRDAPSFFNRVIEFERTRCGHSESSPLTASEVRFAYRAEEVIASNLQLLIEHSMPSDVCAKICDAFLNISRPGVRDEVIDMWKWFARSSMCSSVVEGGRIPEPVGRPALIAALKIQPDALRLFDWARPLDVHHFPVTLPDSPSTWRYFAQRLTSLGALKNPEVRDLRVAAYVTSFREFLVAQPFYKREEQFFREINLLGKGSQAARHFYSEEYGVDSPPGTEDSKGIELPLRETAQAFRIMAAARFGLNIRKGYTRAVKGSTKWLLEHMADELKGEFARYRCKDIDLYPGSGARMWGLDLRNAIDLSTSESRKRWLQACPWIASSLRVGGEVEYHFTRGFKAIARTLDAAARPLSPEWRRRGSYDGEPYAALIFNDHFHNDLLPEVRMWLVPERVFHRKIVWAIENNVDMTTLDLTPEGLAEEADALNVPIFDVGSSCCRWATFANAWPHGQGPAFAWEVGSDLAYSRWQSPRHIHRGLAGELYSEKLTEPVARAMSAARAEHDKIKHLVNFFLDLHSSFLTMEEAWAKGYAIADEGPAKEESDPDPELKNLPGQGSTVSPFADSLSDLTPWRPRNRMLDHFLELRNHLNESAAHAGERTSRSLDIRMELQYTRLFLRQEGTPYISGADMTLVFPDGRVIPLLGETHQPGSIVTRRVEIDERMEALWDQYMVSRFAPNNCPRIIYP